MRSNLFLLSCLLVLCFTSCQKSIEWNDLVLTPTTPTTPTTPGGGTTTGTLLIKAVSLSLTDTTTVLYTYDASKKLIKSQTVGTSSSTKVDNSETFIRNANGNVTKYTMIRYSATSFNASGYDTTITTIHYPNGSSNYDYSIITQEFLGFVFSDSTTYEYSNGKIVRSKLYITDIVTGGYLLSSQTDYTYDANSNLTLYKTYDYTTSTSPTLVASYTFEYDTKKSPLILGNEGIVLNRQSAVGANNVSKLTLIDNTNTPPVTLGFIVTYNYNANSMPSDTKTVVTYNGVSATTNSTLFYQ